MPSRHFVFWGRNLDNHSVLKVRKNRMNLHHYLKTTLFFYFLFGILPNCGSTTLKFLRLQDLAIHASDIVTATVAGRQSFWDDSNRGVWTRTLLQVGESLKGHTKTGQILTLLQRGGTLPERDLAQIDGGSVDLSPGETVLLFLQSLPNDTYRPYGLCQGIFFIDQKGEHKAYRKINGVNIIGAESAEGIDRRLFTDSLPYRQLVDAVTEQLKKNPEPKKRSADMKISN